MGSTEIKKNQKSLEKGIRNWYKFHGEQEDEFKRILDEATPDEHGVSRIPLTETEGFYGLPGYKDNLTLNAAVKVDKGDNDKPDYYIEADFVKPRGNGELEVLSHTTIDFEELSDAITLSDVMHSMYSWEFEQFGDE